jgi:hypothetical protein
VKVVVCFAFSAIKVDVEGVRTQVAGNTQYKINLGIVSVLYISLIFYFLIPVSLDIILLDLRHSVFC